MVIERKYKIGIIAVILIAVIAGAYLYYTMRPPVEVEPTLVVVASLKVESICPHLTTMFIFPTDLPFESLLFFKPPATVEPSPGLAESWTVSSDMKTYDFFLREGVKFHDGTEMDAESVKFSMERFKEVDSPHLFIVADIESVEVVDKYHVRFHLKEPSNVFLNKMAVNYASPIVSPSAVGEAGEKWGVSVAVGTGPFKIVEWRRGERIVYERFEDYWGPKPNVKKIILLEGVEPSAARLMMERGEADVYIIATEPTEVKALLANPKLGSYSAPDNNAALVMNQRFPPLDDVRVRQAIAYAIDPEEIRKVGWKGLGDVAYSFCQPWIKPYSLPVFSKYRYDLNKAEELLREAGYPNGFKIDYYWSPDYWVPKEVPIVIKEQLAKVGIDVTLHMVDYSTFSEMRWTTFSIPLSTFGWYPDYPDPENVLTETLTGEGGYYVRQGGWKEIAENPDHRMNILARVGRETLNVDERIKIYNEMQLIAAEEVPAYPMVDTYRHYFWQKWVLNFVVYPNYSSERYTFGECDLAPPD